MSTKSLICPFCPLLCDDLSINEHFHIETHNCQKAKRGFAQTNNFPSPQIRGKTVTLEKAIAEMQRIIKQAQLPLYSGLEGVDVAGIRAIIRLAEQTGGIIDADFDNFYVPTILTVQNSGWMTTTLAEVRKRADLVILVGNQINLEFPRLLDRWISCPNSPDIVVIGENNSLPNNTYISIKNNELLGLIAILRAFLAEKQLQIEKIGNVTIAQLTELLKRMKTAKYGIIIWHTNGLNPHHTDLIIQTLCELVKDLNKTTRFSVLPLNGNTAIQVSTWQTGYPVRISFTKKLVVEYDVWRFSGQRLLTENEVDTLIWISTLKTVKLPNYSVPTILLARILPIDLKREPDVFIPIGTPGLDHDGHLVRVDNVMLSVSALYNTKFPSVAQVLMSLN